MTDTCEYAGCNKLATCKVGIGGDSGNPPPVPIRMCDGCRVTSWEELAAKGFATTVNYSICPITARHPWESE